MEIATIINASSQIDIIQDTLESVITYCSNNTMIIFDGKKYHDLTKVNYGVEVINGFDHGVKKSPYRNVALGLNILYQKFPKNDWYCYTEDDCIFGSERFKKNLELADQKDIWMLGFCGRSNDTKMPLVEAMIGEDLRDGYYLLGSCLFFSKKYIQKLIEIDFFNRFIHLTTQFDPGLFPGFKGYDISENMYPTLARHFGGGIGVFSTYDEFGKWHGAYEYYPVRWRPEIDEIYPKASIIHPLKSMNKIREFYKNRRCNVL